MALGKVQQLNSGLAKQMEARQKKIFSATSTPSGNIRLEEGDELLWVDVDMLDDNPFQPRQTYHAEDQQRMVLDLNRDGQLEAVQVRVHPEKPGFYQLIAGGHSRKYAVRDGAEFPGENGELRRVFGNAGSQMPSPEQYRGKLQVVLKKQPVTDLEMRRRAYRENKGRSDTRPLDDAHFYEETRKHLSQNLREQKKLKDQKEASWRAVAEFLGEDNHTHIWRISQLLGLPDKIKEALNNGKINERHGRALLLLQAHPQQQDTLLAEILNLGMDGIAAERAAESRVKSLTSPLAEDSPSGGGGGNKSKTGHGTDSKLVELSLPEQVLANLTTSESALKEARKKLKKLDLVPDNSTLFKNHLEKIDTELKAIKQLLAKK